MKDRIVWWAAVLTIACAAAGPSDAQVITNMIRNPGFETGAISPWTAGGSAVATVTATVVDKCDGAAVPEDPIEGTYCLNVKVSGPGADWWDGSVTPSLVAAGSTFQKGKKYTLSVFLKSKRGTATVNLKPEHAADPWEGYGESQVTITDKWTEFHITTPVMLEDVTPAHVTIHVLFAAQEFWIDDAKWYEGDYIPTVVTPRRGAKGSGPAAMASDVARDVTLSWKAGPFAATHNVYLGTSQADVNNATVGSALLVGPGLTDTIYQPAAPLEYGKTYYWRVDEVNAPPSTTAFKGEVWSFTVEPYTYPLTSVTASASSVDKTTSTAGNTVNDTVGLVNDLHGTETTTMWLSKSDPNGAWIQYQFDKTYKLSELWVWNYNAGQEKTLGCGFKDVTIDYSVDGTTWTTLGDVQFAQGPSSAGYAHNTTVNLQEILARYVRLTAKSNWSKLKLKQYGLSEVRFYYIPVQAYLPQPATRTSGVSVDALLDWRPGRDTTSQKVYLSTDQAAVTGGTVAAQTVTTHGFTPATLDFGTIYYWKVDEIGAAAYPGDVWRFTTEEYENVDDFESYTEQDGFAVFQAWIDGTMDSRTGSTVGLLDAVNGTYCATDIYHGGSQSMPFAYDNTLAPYYSEAVRTFDDPQNWLAHGADSLLLYYRGFPADAAADQQKNVPDSLYVTVEDKSTQKKTVVHSDPAAVNQTGWTAWRISYSDLTGVNLGQVKKLTIGVGNKTSPKVNATGLLYIDDIQFGKPVEPVGLVANYTLENNVTDVTGHGYDGTVIGTPTYVTGAPGSGKGMLFPGTPDSCVYLGTFDPSDRTGLLTVSLWAKWNGVSGQWQGLIGKRHDVWDATMMMWQIEASQTDKGLRFQRAGIDVLIANTLPQGEWAHVAVTFDGTTARTYLNGQPGGQGAFSFGTDLEAPLQIGSSTANGGNPFNGALDEVRLYDIVLTPAEILALAGH